jgi:hypothetical protein
VVGRPLSEDLAKLVNPLPTLAVIGREPNRQGLLGEPLAEHSLAARQVDAGGIGERPQQRRQDDRLIQENEQADQRKTDPGAADQ